MTVGANNQWVFSQCVNGRTGCNPGGIAGTQSTCISTGGLLSTGFDAAASGVCDSNSLLGGGSGWLTFAGNVVPGELATLRLAIWDSGDSSEDSTVVLDSLEWLTEPVTAGGSF